MLSQMIPAFRMTLLFTVLTGLVYPGVVTGLCQLLFHEKANGSLVSANGRIVGSAILGQNFPGPSISTPGPPPRDPTATMHPIPLLRTWARRTGNSLTA